MTFTERLELLVSAVTSQARTEFDKLKGSVQSTFGDFDKFKESFAQGIGIGAGASAFEAAANAVQKIGTFLIDSSKAAEDDARSQFVLASALKNVTGANGEAIAGAEQYIATLQNQAAIADDELRPALSTLVRSTGDLTEAQKLLSLSADISAGTGRDLGSVSEALSKAYQGNTKSLKALAPEVNNLIRDGASLGEIFNTLQKTYQGNAEGLADVSPWQKLNVQIGEAKEKIGVALLPTIQVLAKSIEEDIGPALEDLGPTIETAGKLFAQLVQPLVQGARALEYLSEKVNDLRGDAFDDLIDQARAAGVEVKGAGDAASGTSQDFSNLTGSTNEAADAAKNLAASYAQVRASGSGAFDSIFGAQSKQSSFVKSLADGGSGASNSAKQIERAYRQIQDAQQGVIDAQENLDEALIERFLIGLGASSDDITLAQIAERDSTRSLTAAQRELSDTQDRLNKLRQPQDRASQLDAEANYIEAQRRLVAAQGTGDAVELNRAQADLLRTQQALTDARNPATAKELAAAEDDVSAAADGVTKAQINAKRSQQELTDLQNAGKEGSKELAAANKLVDDAQRALTKTNQALIDAQDALNESTKNLGGSTKSANDKFLEGIGSANSWLQFLIDNKATPEEFGGAVKTIYENLRSVAEQAGETDNLDAYLTKVTGIYTALQGISNTPIIGTGSSANAAEEALRRNETKVVMNLDGRQFGEAVVTGLLAYQNANGSVPIKVR